MTIKYLFYLLTTLPFSIPFCTGQPGQYSLIDPKEQVYLRYITGQNSITGRFENLPDGYVFGSLAFHTLNGVFVCGTQLADDEPFQFNVSLPSDTLQNDTLLMSIAGFGIPRYFSPIKLFPKPGDWQRISLEQGCVRIACVPNQKPYMPSVENPRLICLENWYLNWENGKIMSGKKALDKYSDCEIRDWIMVDPDRYYTDLKQNRKKGLTIIKRKRIDTSEWSKDTFERP